MKLIFIIASASGIFLISCAQNIPASRVPSVVVNLVQGKFPAADDIEWKNKKNYYEAEFIIDSAEHSLLIDSSGKLMQHKREIRVGTLPGIIHNAVKSNHPGYAIDDVALIDKYGQIIYELELEAKGKKDKKVFFSAEGQTIINK